MNTVATKAGYAIVAALIGVGLFAGVIARAVTTVVCGSVTMPGDFITGLRLVVFGTTSVASVPTGCTVPLTGIRIASLLVFLTIAGVAVWAGMLWFRWKQSDAYFVHEMRYRDGWAKRAEVRRHASAKAMLSRAKTIRPSLPNPTPADVGWRLGTSMGMDVYVSVEDSIVVEGPPRSGKGYRLLISSIIDWSGPLITTSTRSDNLTATMRARAARGSVSVFDPQQLSGVDAGLKVSPMTGCTDPLTAMQRGQAIVSGTALGTSSSNGEWADVAASVMAKLLHAAAVSGAGVDKLYTWGSSPSRAREAVDILRVDGTPGWATELEALVDGDPKLLASSWFGVAGAVRPLSIPSIRDVMSPRRGEGLDPGEFLDGTNTLYLIGTGSGAGAVGGFLGAVLDDVVEVARRTALTLPGSSLTAPLGLVLDEIANMFRWSALPRVMADGGGIGISTLVVLQALSQAETAWSRAEADTIWSAATAKVLLGGAGDVSHLRDVESLLGTRKVARGSKTYADSGESESVSKEQVPVMSLDEIRRMPQQMGLLAYKNRRGILLDLQGWTDRADAASIVAGRKSTEREQLAAFQKQYGQGHR